MATKLWEKSTQVNAKIEAFTVGRDREMDIFLAKYDVLGSMAHIRMLESVGLLQTDELEPLLEELKNIYHLAESNQFVIDDGVEDVHSQVEILLTRKLGDIRIYKLRCLRRSDFGLGHMPKALLMIYNCYFLPGKSPTAIRLVLLQDMAHHSHSTVS